MKLEENAIAHNLKEIRESRNLSLDQLSGLTGVSKSMLRQVETGRSSPTISTIWKIANGLRLSFSTLLSKRRPKDVAIINFNGNPPLTAEGGKYRCFPIIPFDPEGAFEVYHIEIDPGTAFIGEPHQGSVEEIIFVNQGHLEITVEENHYSVECDQCVRFLANCTHTYRSTGEEMVTGIMILRYLS